MNEQKFKARIADLSPGSVNNYVSIGRRIERELACDLDALDLSTAGLDTLSRRLRALHPGAAGDKHVGDCVSVLRAYAGLRTPRASDATLVAAASSPSPPRPAAIRAASVGDLLTMHGDVMDELFDRGVIRTGNPPAGDYAEHLFARAFGWRLNPNSSAGIDATDGEGVRYQIKGRRVTERNPSRQLSSIRRLPEGAFDVLAAVLFGRGHKVFRGVLIPRSVVEGRATYVKRTNSWRFMLEDRVWEQPGVQDVTLQLRGAAASA